MANTLELGNGKWATGKDTVLAFNDENNNFKPLPFSFSRASSATVINKDGLIETVGAGEPRIDFKDNTKGALLLEPQRTNYVLKSNDFSLLSGGFVTPNYGTSPEGLSVSRILFTDANQSMSSGTSLSAGVVCNFSAYVKGIKGQFIKFAAGGVDIAHTFSGEWERLSGSATSINNSWNLNTYGYATARDFLLCGAQLEEGSYATSYIPTSGSAVTRVAEQGIDGGAGTPIFSNTSAVWFIDLERNGADTDSSGSAIALRNSSFSQQIRLHFDAPATNIRFRDGVNGYATISTITGANTNVRKKLALRIDGSTLSTFSNGSKIGSDYTAPNSFNIDEVDFSSIGFKIHDMRFYNTALTDQELIALTQ